MGTLQDEVFRAVGGEDFAIRTEFFRCAEGGFASAGRDVKDPAAGFEPGEREHGRGGVMVPAFKLVGPAIPPFGVLVPLAALCCLELDRVEGPLCGCRETFLSVICLVGRTAGVVLSLHNVATRLIALGQSDVAVL